MYKHITIALAVLLSACGGGGSSTTDNGTSAPADTPMTEERSCESLREDVIRIAATNNVNIVKIYSPKMIKTEPKKISCSGRALVSSGQEALIYYRTTQDADGDWLVQYGETKLD